MSTPPSTPTPTGRFHPPKKGWRSTAPDLAGCALALLLAWSMGWKTGDLIWSMWLASLVIGYALIVWQLFGHLLIGLFHDGKGLVDTAAESPGIVAAGILLIVVGKLFLLAFFTVHFGGFHYVHSIFVNEFFPIWPELADTSNHPGLADYLEVVKRYAWFLPLAFFGQRNQFKWPDIDPARDKRRMAEMRAGEPPRHASHANSTRLANRTKSHPGTDFGAAYKGVVRLHLLIFFLAGTHALETPEFATYTVVYLVYFFPWRKVIGSKS